MIKIQIKLKSERVGNLFWKKNKGKEEIIRASLDVPNYKPDFSRK